MDQPDADPFDLICHVAFSAPIRSRRERAERLSKGRVDFWEYFKPEAREILTQILDKYVEHGTTEFRLPDILRVAPVSDHGNPVEIAAKFGGADQLKTAVERMQVMLYED
jgi:type I restriction enzyme R subunit